MVRLQAAAGGTLAIWEKSGEGSDALLALFE